MFKRIEKDGKFYRCLPVKYIEIYMNSIYNVQVK